MRSVDCEFSQERHVASELNKRTQKLFTNWTCGTFSSSFRLHLSSSSTPLHFCSMLLAFTVLISISTKRVLPFFVFNVKKFQLCFLCCFFFIPFHCVARSSSHFLTPFVVFLFYMISLKRRKIFGFKLCIICDWVLHTKILQAIAYALLPHVSIIAVLLKRICSEYLDFLSEILSVKMHMTKHFEQFGKKWTVRE